MGFIIDTGIFLLNIVTELETSVAAAAYAGRGHRTKAFYGPIIRPTSKVSTFYQKFIQIIKNSEKLQKKLHYLFF